jgi:hypothetical protein
MQPGMGMQPGMQYMMGPQGNYIPMGYAPQMAQMQAGQMGGMRPGQRPPNMQPGAGMGYPGGVQYLVGPQQGQQGVPPGVMLAPPGAPLPHGARPVRGESRRSPCLQTEECRARSAITTTRRLTRRRWVGTGAADAVTHAHGSSASAWGSSAQQPQVAGCCASQQPQVAGCSSAQQPQVAGCCASQQPQVAGCCASQRGCCAGALATGRPATTCIPVDDEEEATRRHTTEVGVE